ncbi:uncharacterized protein [Antedon mediterranea]
MAQHWVEELFPPTFKYNSLGELLTNEKQLQEMKTTKFEPCTNSRTSEPIDKIYDRVRLSYNNDVEARKQKCIQVGNPLRKSQQKSTIESPTVSTTATNEDSCLWTNYEMKILRGSYQTMKTEKCKIEQELKVLKSALKEKEEKLKLYRKKFENKCKVVKRLSEENAHKEIECNDLCKELKAAQSVEVFLREDIADLENQKHSQQKVIGGLRKDLAQEKRNRTQISLDLAEIQQKFEHESELREERIRLEYEIEIKKLCKQIDKLVKELDKEKNDHVISKKGLDHLRAHFAGIIDITNEDNTNELNKFTLY